jgi:hypothetical protein
MANDESLRAIERLNPLDRDLIINTYEANRSIVHLFYYMRKRRSQTHYEPKDERLDNNCK